MTRLAFRRTLWRLGRLIVAAWLLCLAVSDHTARQARLELASLPTVNYRSVAGELRNQGKFADAEQIILAGIAEAEDPQERESLALDLRETIRARDDSLRKLHSFARGAVLGTGDDLESLLGAITADLFVVGDVRDLLIQSGRWMNGGDPDELLVALSAAGIAATVAPHLDAAGALVKAARRAGSLSQGMTRALRTACSKAIKGGGTGDLRRIVTDVNRIASRSSPSVALRTLRWCDEPADLARTASLAAQPSGGAALLLVGEEGATTLRKLGPAAEDAVLLAAHRTGGAGWLRTSAAAFRPHPLLGAFKGIYKGNVPRAALEAMQMLDRAGWMLIPALATWLYFELCWAIRSLSRPPIGGVRTNRTPGGSPALGAVHSSGLHELPTA